MAIGQQPDGKPFDKISLSNDDFAQFIKKRMHKCARFLYRLVDCVNSGVHFLKMLPNDGQTNQKMRSSEIVVVLQT